MSGSFDRPAPPQRPLAPTQSGQDDADYYYDEPTHGHLAPRSVPQHVQPSLGHAVPGDGHRRELKAHSRGDTASPASGRTPIVPAGSVTGRSLTLVVSIMCFLACLTAGAVYMINEQAAAWTREIASEVTVQVEPQARGDIEKTIADVSGFLTRQTGVASVKALTVADSAALLEPWLGQTDALKSLPMPRLIAVELDRNALPDLALIRAELQRQFPSANLDDHRQWQQQIRALTRSIALGGLAILLLVGAATTAIIVSATRSAMASNREIVEVLHYVGATDRFIAREFEGHFLRLGVKAGLVGAICATVAFLVLPLVMQLLGGGILVQAELSRLIGSGVLDLKGYLVLGCLVVVVAALCMLTSRFGVYRILRTQQ